MANTVLAMETATIEKTTFGATCSIPKCTEHAIFSGKEVKPIISALDRSFDPNVALCRAMKAASKIEANSLSACAGSKFRQADS